ncbi:hypothetical protein GCM10009665_39980 [Kitasatospora nipponensis]|uniref:Uncharacterized protein n=1 Tax=Kitasatospora nipponensis TaxID=258049 RepID=A0ABN1WFV8_9ACTN
MTRDLITVCLPPSDPDEVSAALTAAMAPFEYDGQPAGPGGEWQGEWDWWHVFGGDGENGLAVRPGCEDDRRLLRNPRWSDGSARPLRPARRCDGGPRGLLDLDADRSSVRGSNPHGHWTCSANGSRTARTGGPRPGPPSRRSRSSGL